MKKLMMATMFVSAIGVLASACGTGATYRETEDFLAVEGGSEGSCPTAGCQPKTDTATAAQWGYGLGATEAAAKAEAEANAKDVAELEAESRVEIPPCNEGQPQCTEFGPPGYNSSSGNAYSCTTGQYNAAAPNPWLVACENRPGQTLPIPDCKRNKNLQRTKKWWARCAAYATATGTQQCVDAPSCTATEADVAAFASESNASLDRGE